MCSSRSTLLCRMVVGCTMAILGFTMYSYASIESKRRKTLTVFTTGPNVPVKDQDAGESITNPLLERRATQV